MCQEKLTCLVLDVACGQITDNIINGMFTELHLHTNVAEHQEMLRKKYFSSNTSFVHRSCFMDINKIYSEVPVVYDFIFGCYTLDMLNVPDAIELLTKLKTHASHGNTMFGFLTNIYLKQDGKFEELESKHVFIDDDKHGHVWRTQRLMEHIFQQSGFELFQMIQFPKVQLTNNFALVFAQCNNAEVEQSVATAEYAKLFAAKPLTSYQTKLIADPPTCTSNNVIQYEIIKTDVIKT